MLANIFYSFLNLTVVGSIVALVVLFIRIIFRKSIKKSAFVLLWIIVFLRLSIPFSISSPTSVLNLFGNNSSQTIIGGIDVTNNFIKNTPKNTNDPKYISKHLSQKKHAENSMNISNKVTVNTSAQNSNERNYNFSTMDIFTAVWIAGISIMIIFAISIYLLTIRKIKPLYSFESRELESCKQILKIKRHIPVYISDKINSACALGIIKPKIILSKDLYTASNTNKLTHVLLHELTHIKKFDNFVKLFCTLVLFINWYNPIVWISYIMLTKDIEASCDENVLRAIGENSKKDYAYSLYEFANKESRVMNIGFNSFGETNTKFRIRNILNYKNTTIVTAVITFLVVSSVIVSCATNPFKKGIPPFYDSKTAYVTSSGLWYTRIEKSTPVLLVKGKNIMHPIFSPNGNTVLFTQNNNLYSVDISSIKKHLLLSKVISYCFTKDGNIYASSVKAGIIEFASKNLKATSIIKSSKNTDFENFTLSPNGKYLAFEKNIVTSTSYRTLGTWLLDTKSKTAKVIIKSASNDNNLMNSVRPINCKWSSDSKKLFVWLAYMAGSLSTDGVPSAIYDVSTGKLQRLNDKYGFGLYYKENVSFADNNNFAIISGGDRMMWMSKTLGIVNYNKNMTYKEIKTPGLVPTNPSFSKDGSAILFAAVPSGSSDLGGKKTMETLSKQQIYMYTNGTVIKLTNNTNYRSTSPQFMVNNNYIIFTRINNATHKASIWIMNKNGKNQRMLENGIRDLDESNFGGFYGHVDWNNVYALHDNTK